MTRAHTLPLPLSAAAQSAVESLATDHCVDRATALDVVGSIQHMTGWQAWAHLMQHCKIGPQRATMFVKTHFPALWITPGMRR